MTVKRRVVYFQVGVVAALLAFFGATAFAQQADEASADESEELEELEEIVVVAPKPGGRRRVDKEYEDPARAKLLQDLYELEIDQEEYEWRKSAAIESPSRIQWGYDPTADYEMRNRLGTQSLPFENNKPATLFRVGF